MEDRIEEIKKWYHGYLSGLIDCYWYSERNGIEEWFDELIENAVSDVIKEVYEETRRELIDKRSNEH